MTSRRLVAVVFTILIVATTHIAQAAIIEVEQDGSGDHLTLTDAVAAASANDTILVGPGTYFEGPAIAIAIPLTIMSTFGPTTTGFAGTGDRILAITNAAVRIEGILFSNGSSGAGGAVVISSGGQATFVDCVFQSNTSAAGGAIYVSDSNLGLNASLTAVRCSFFNNQSTGTGGAVSVVLGATADFLECHFEGNSASSKGGAVWVFRATGNTQLSLYVENTSGDVAGAFYIDTAVGSVLNNTFVDNTSSGPITGTVTVVDSPVNEVSRNIIVGDTEGFGLRYWNTAIGPHTCNVFWNNDDGPIGGGSLGATEVVADPLFCDAPSGNYTIHELSPASPLVNACSVLVGALPVACMTTVAVDEKPWSEIKQLYR